MNDPADDPAHTAWPEDLHRRSDVISFARLRPVASATTVRARGDETLICDGPFAETKDFVGGFLALDCADLDVAVEIAAGHPTPTGSLARPGWR